LVPDPIYTRLALLFDRTVEAIQQAAADLGYQVDDAYVAW